MPDNEQPQSLSLSLNDIYFVLFRQKWKIILFSVVAILAAALVLYLKPPLYQSEAKLLIRYVLETRSVNPAGGDSQIMAPDARGENILNSEMEILNSLDLALTVADAIGPDKILARAGGGTNRYEAADVIIKGLRAEVSGRSTVIRVVFQHPDPGIAEPALKQLVEGYLKKHVEVHRPTGILDDIFARQTDELRAKLAQTEERLRELKAKAGVISLEDARRSMVEQLARIRQDLYTAEADLGEQGATLKELEKLAPSKSGAAASELGVTLEALNDYRSLSAQLDLFRNRERGLLAQYTDENPMAKRIQEEIANTETRIRKLMQEHPKLATLNLPSGGTNAQPVDLAVATSRIRALEARVAVLNSQMDHVRTNAANLDQVESAITQLERKKALEETNYMYFSTSLEQFRIDEALGAGKLSNINVVQAPSPAVLGLSPKTKKLLGMVLAFGILGGVGLAFLLELYVDQSVKRPSDLEARVRAPVLLSIPDTGRTRKRRLFRTSEKPSAPLAEPTQESKAGPNRDSGQSGGAEIAPWDANHSLHAYQQALRDRLMTYFEQKQMTHKPKLVAVTNCSPRAGATTIATGLAAALSETGDGNVLLVDMDQQSGTVHPFYRGEPKCRLSDILEGENKETALVQDNLYMVSASEANGLVPRALPKQFTHLVPKLKASDYDYIIFDMPPVSQTSMTPRLAGFMDMVLLVVESEKTNRDVAGRAWSMLAESGANVRAILNKYRTYVPKSLLPEL